MQIDLCASVCVWVISVSWLVWNNYNNKLLKWDDSDKHNDNIYADEAASREPRNKTKMV